MNIAVFLPNWIGDAVMATPALRALRSHFAGDHIVGVLRPYVAGVLEGGDWFDRLILSQDGSCVRRAAAATAWKGSRRSASTWPSLLPNSFRAGARCLDGRRPPARRLCSLWPIRPADRRSAARPRARRAAARQSHHSCLQPPGGTRRLPAGRPRTGTVSPRPPTSARRRYPRLGS